MDETADGAIETLQEFIETLQNAAASSGLVTSLVHKLTQAVSRVVLSCAYITYSDTELFLSVFFHNTGSLTESNWQFLDCNCFSTGR